MLRRTILISCFLFFALFAQPGFGYQIRFTKSGEIIRWHKPTIEITLDPSIELLGNVDEVENTIMDMFEIWSEQACVPINFKFDFNECFSLGYSRTEQNENCVMASDSNDFDNKGEYHRAGATTILSYNPESGAVVDADIVFNAKDWRWSTYNAKADELDICSVAAHEGGHFLGLAHSEIPDAVMYSEALVGENFNGALHSDDIAAIKEAYDGFENDLMDDEMAAFDCSVTPARTSSLSRSTFLLFLAEML